MGNKNTPVTLPLESPFFLLAYGALQVKVSKGRGPGCNGSSTMLMICRLRAIDTQAQFHIGPAANMETTRFTTATTCVSIVCFPIDRVKFPT